VVVLARFAGESQLDYGALLAAMTSPFVAKAWLGR